MAEMGSARWYEPVLDLWFRQLDYKAWFTKSDSIDVLVRERGLAVYERVRSELPGDVGMDRHATVAAVVVLDQFPRNIFRGTPQAFATDPVALSIAKRAVAGGLDQHLGKSERMFLYLPFEHSEDKADQQRSVELFATLDDVELSRYAEAHKAIVDRFGRFPHRNAILGRVSTTEEVAFLQQPGSSF